MKKFILFMFVGFTLLAPFNKAHAMDPKTKAFLVMTTYGTVGGALLGFASLAFGGKSRAIAQGASLGLYAGIIFGVYVLHSYNKDNSAVEDEYVPEPYYNPYSPQAAPAQDNGGFGAPVPNQAAPDDGGGFFGNRIQELNDKYMNDFGGHKRINHMPPIYVNIFNTSF